MTRRSVLLMWLAVVYFQVVDVSVLTCPSSGSRSAAVSYTHLDVYKRQALHGTCSWWLKSMISFPRLNIFRLFSESVISIVCLLYTSLPGVDAGFAGQL